MYAADELKILKSKDGGITWLGTATTVAGARSTECKYDGPDTVLVAGPNLFKRSFNGGSSWSDISMTSKPTAILSFPGNPGRFLIGRKYYSSDEKSISSTTNYGTTWTQELSGTYTTMVVDFAVNLGTAYNDFTMAAGTPEGAADKLGVYYSEDYGNTWAMKMGTVGIGWTAVAFGYNPDISLNLVYAGTADGKIYKGTWKAISMTQVATLGDTIRRLRIDPSNTAIAYALTDKGIFKTTNTGSAWSIYTSGMYDSRSYSVELSPSASSTIIAGTKGFIFRSTNSASSWSVDTGGATRTLPVISAAVGLSKVYAGLDGLTAGIGYASSTWGTVRIGHQDSTFFTHQSLNVFDSNAKRVIIHAGVGDNKAGLYRSVDSGATFPRHPAFDSLNTICEGIAQDLSYPARLYAYGLLKDGTNIRNFFKSDDYGASWTKSTSTITSSNRWLTMRALGDGNGVRSRFVYAGVVAGGGTGGLYHSSDTSVSFNRIASVIADQSIYSLANSPNCPGYLYVGGDNGLYYSSSANSTNYTSVSFSNPWYISGVKKVLLDPRFLHSSYNAADLFWVGMNNHIYRSENSGSSATDVTGNLPGGIVINDLRYDPSDTLKLYIASDQGVYVAHLIGAPTALTPVNGDPVLSCYVTAQNPLVFSWTNVSGATSYDLQIDNNSDFSSPEYTYNGISNPYNKTSIDCGSTFYWRVRASDGSSFGKGSWSATFSFTTSTCNPPDISAPTLLSPQNGFTGVELSPTLRWTKVTGAVKYKVIIEGLTPKFTADSTDTTQYFDGLSEGTTYYWKVISLNCGADNDTSARWWFLTCTNCTDQPGGTTTPAQEAENQVVKKYHLAQNFPNPFNPVTHLEFTLPEAGEVKLRVFNILGEEVVRLVDGHRPAGTWAVEFDASSLPSGVYIYRLDTPAFTSIRKMLLVK